METLLVGANPGVRLFVGDDVTAYASIWRVDWSQRGSGAAIVLWRAGDVRVLASDVELGRHLERDFTRHFPEVSGLPWHPVDPEQCRVEIDLDLERGLRAVGADVEITMSGVLDRRAFTTDDFALDQVPHSLQLVIAPMATATISVSGVPVPGDVRIAGSPARPTSSAFLAEAEVWSRGQSPARS